MSPEAKQFLSEFGELYLVSGCPNPEGWLFSYEPEEEAVLGELVAMGYVTVARYYRLTSLGVDWIMKNIAPGEDGARAVLSVLQRRGIAVPDAERERILVEKNRGRLESWLERAFVASSIAEVVGYPRGDADPT
ncbi:MAG: hypothetical protein QM820_57145 [Minicystis sp.]